MHKEQIFVLMLTIAATDLAIAQHLLHLRANGMARQARPLARLFAPVTAPPLAGQRGAHRGAPVQALAAPL